MTTLILLLLLQEQPDFLRITFEVEITEGHQQVGARMVLNRLDEQTFSIHCSKTTSGTLFTYWATPKNNTLYLPKSELAFVGGADESFQLFPRGPSLPRNKWVELLEADPPEKLGAFTIADEAGWRLMRNREAALTIRWREKKRGTRSRFGKRTFQPGYEDGTTVVPLVDAPQYWAQ